MQLKNLLPVALSAAVSAQSLSEALASQNASLSLLTNLIGTQPALLNALGSAQNITILAPNNAALSAFVNSTAGRAAATNPGLVAAVLSYHVLNGTYRAADITNKTAFVPTLLQNSTYTNVTGGQVVGAKANGSSVAFYSGLLQSSDVTQANLNFTGGVIHIIDEVLTLPQSPSNTALAANLTALYGALNATNLVTAVDGLRDVTIFAPSNAAFAAIGSIAGNLTTQQASDILRYHVVQGNVVYSSDITGNTTLETLGGGSINISVINGTVYANSAKVVATDVLISNGVVHVIDNVLNPANASATPNPATTAPAFPGASTASGGSTPFTSGVTGSTTITNAPTQTGAPGAGATSSRSTGAAPHATAAVGFGALLGAGALVWAY